MSAVTTHVLDTARGRPAVGIPVRLERVGTAARGEPIAEAVTDDDGRAAALGPDRLPAGHYRLVFDTAAWFEGGREPAFFPEVSISFALTDPQEHYHVPLLLSPFAYSTYRGS
jgi:5-hydroxyisourate hydrolase